VGYSSESFIPDSTPIADTQRPLQGVDTWEVG
jgi:hypothetical protein